MRATLDTLQPAIDKAIGAFAPGASETLRGRARVMAADALAGYDPQRGTRLSTHLYGHLQSLKQMVNKLGNPMPLPERVRRDQGKVLQAAQELRDKLDRDPSDDEVAEHSEIPLRGVRKVMRAARQGVPLSAYEIDEEDGPSVVGSTRTPEDDWAEAVDHGLSPIDKLILRYRTGYDQHPILSNQEIAAKLNLTAPAVSRRAAGIQEQLDQYQKAPRGYQHG